MYVILRILFLHMNKLEFKGLVQKTVLFVLVLTSVSTMFLPIWSHSFHVSITQSSCSPNRKTKLSILWTCFILWIYFQQITQLHPAKKSYTPKCVYGSLHLNCITINNRGEQTIINVLLHLGYSIAPVQYLNHLCSVLGFPVSRLPFMGGKFNY